MNVIVALCVLFFGFVWLFNTVDRKWRKRPPGKREGHTAHTHIFKQINCQFSLVNVKRTVSLSLQPLYYTIASGVFRS